MKRSNIYGVVAAAAVILLSVALISWYLTKRSPMLIQGTVECTTYKASSKVPGRIDAMKVAEGDRVEKGQLLYVLSTPELDAKLAQAEAVKALGEALPVIYAGVAMGQLFKGRLRPDPALAFFCGLNRDAVPAAELDEEQTLRFLRRQEIGAGPFAEGINLVCARGRALGFAKRIGNRVNNMYPNSLRIIKQ